MASALPPTATVAVIGAGAMGSGIAQIAAQHGHRVQLHDSRFGAADAAKRAIGDALAKLVAKERIDAAQRDATLARIGTVGTLADTCVASLVVEAIVEDLDAKRELVAMLENVVSPQCVLASNTSSLSITAIARGAKHPGRIVGMHFFNPAPLMPLVEVVSGLATDRAVADTVFATAAAWDKTPVYARSTPGFIVNRCARPFYGEALRLLAEGAADPPTIDAVMREAGGFRMGPFELMDLIGHDVNFAVTKSVWEAYFHDPRYAPSVAQQELVAAGFLGRKSGRGFHDYAPDAVSRPPRTEPPAARPARVALHGDGVAASPLAERLAAAGVAVDRAAADPRFADGALSIGGAWLALSDGRTATARAHAAELRDVVLCDLALDFSTAKRLAIACADGCADDARSAAVGALQAAGIAVSRFDDVAGLAVLRTVATLANEAADAVAQGIALAADVDLAMKKGVNYPRGPLEWADALGVGRIVAVLANLASHYGEDRYRVSPLVARRALTGGRLRG
jgi:3-hydroxybutyryl-CoA dehydrogenase